MSTQNIIRAWKDESYRSSLSQAELAALPPNPAGVITLSDTGSARKGIGLTYVCTHTGCSLLRCW